MRRDLSFGADECIRYCVRVQYTEVAGFASLANSPINTAIEFSRLRINDIEHNNRKRYRAVRNQPSDNQEQTFANPSKFTLSLRPELLPYTRYFIPLHPPTSLFPLNSTPYSKTTSPINPPARNKTSSPSSAPAPRPVHSKASKVSSSDFPAYAGVPPAERR